MRPSNHGIKYGMYRKRQIRWAASYKYMTRFKNRRRPCDKCAKTATFFSKDYSGVTKRLCDSCCIYTYGFDPSDE